MDSIKILTCTANMGNAEPTSLSAWIPSKGDVSQVTPLSEEAKEDLEAGSFDIIMVGMQESTFTKKSSSVAYDTDDDDLDEQLKEEAEKGEVVASPANSTSSSSLKKPLQKLDSLLATEDSNCLRTMLKETLGDGYELMKEYQRGQMRLYLFAKVDLVPKITHLELKAENTGIAHVLANKGGIVCTLTIGRTRVTFLTAHLAAHEGNSYYKARNSNIAEILNGCKLGPKHLRGFDTSIMSHHMFIMGDLNYRTRLPGAKEMEKEEQVKTVMKMVEENKFEELYSYDELSAGIEKKEMMVKFKTLPCNFNPTFKMLREEGFKYKDQRIPSYTDRILFTSSPGLDSHLRPLAYEPCPDFSSSDHKPIRGAWSIELNSSIDNTGSTTEFPPSTNPYTLVFKDLKCTNLPAADVNGLADPYIMFLSDPFDILHDDREKKNRRTKAGFNSKKCPVTAYKSRNLNPVWDEEVRLSIPETIETELEGAMLYVAVFDFDLTSEDDLMCSMVLSLKELLEIEDGEETKALKLCAPLLKDGTEQGQIECTIEVTHNGHIQRSEKSRVKGKGRMSMLSQGLSKIGLKK